MIPEQIVMESTAYLRGDLLVMSGFTRIFRRHNYNTNQIASLQHKMIRAGQLVKVAPGTFRRPRPKDNWATKPWRTKTNEQLGIR